MLKITTRSAVEAEQLVKDGYAITAISFFTSNGKLLLTLERGSEWSRSLGSK